MMKPSEKSDVLTTFDRVVFVFDNEGTEDMLYSSQLYRKAQLFAHLTKPLPSEVKSEIKIG
jgi:hypothetical protein